MTNFYETLGVSNDASDAEIKKAYRTLSLQYHPDRNPSEEAKSKIQTINEAYEHLSDSEKRNQYNMELQFGQGHGHPQMNGHPGFGGMPFTHMNSMNGFGDINNIFQMMFGQNGGQPGMPHNIHAQMFGQHMGGGPGIHIFHNGVPVNVIQKPEPITINIQITLEQSYQGSNLPIEIERWVLKNNVRNMENETLYINIPQGIDDNESLTIQDKGHVVNDSVHGDIKISIQVINNTEFKRQGLDIFYSKKVSLKEALCGFSFEIQHLNGKRICLNNNSNPTVIKPNFKKVVPSMGMMRDNSTGNMIIEFDVEFPDILTTEQIAAISNILL